MKKINKQITLGYNASGRRIRKWIHADTLAEFRQQEYELRKAYDKVKNPSDISFGKYAKAWLKTYKANKSSNTYAMYDRAVAKCEEISSLRVCDITRSQLQRVINSYVDQPRTCQQINLTFKQIFKTAIIDGMIAINPAEGLELPTYKAKERRAFTEDERKIIKSVELKAQDRLFLDILYYFGLRRGEAIALTRSDFDFKRLELKVSKSIAFTQNRPNTKPTKTNTVRLVPIPAKIAKTLQKRIAECEFLLFTTETGAPMTLSAYRRMWNRIQKAVNQAAGGSDSFPIFKIKAHDLRHDYATRLYYVPGISTKKKAAILGHQERLFLELYSHLDDGREDLKKFQKLMNF